MDPKLIKLIRIDQNEYKKLPKFTIIHGVIETKFGKCLAAFHNHTLCYLTFFDKTPPKLAQIKQIYPNSTLVEDNKQIATQLKRYFSDEKPTKELEIYLKGTPFEMTVWQTLLRIEPGTTRSYEDVAKMMENPRATRAAARAIAKNHVAYFVPCHRVIAKSGAVHKYATGTHRKVMMLRHEGAAIV